MLVLGFRDVSRWESFKISDIECSSAPQKFVVVIPTWVPKTPLCFRLGLRISMEQ